MQVHPTQCTPATDYSCFPVEHLTLPGLYGSAQCSVVKKNLNRTSIDYSQRFLSYAWFEDPSNLHHQLLFSTSSQQDGTYAERYWQDEPQRGKVFASKEETA